MPPIPAFVIAYSDSDFTNPHEMVLPDEPKECGPDDFTHMGKQYWGLETGRHAATTVDTANRWLEYNHLAHNWVTIGLKERAAISKVAVSTKWFTGNQVRAISVILKDELTGAQKEVLTRTPLRPDAEHEFEITPTLATEAHVELYYEGGLSRIRFFGEKAADQMPIRPNLLEKATISHVSNDHYGHPSMAVNGNRTEMHMVGWESARTGFGERALFTLDRPTVVEEIVVDTYLHRLNPPLTCHIFGLTEAAAAAGDIDELLVQAPRWKIRFGTGLEVIPADFQRYMLDQKYLDEAVEQPHRFKIMLDHDQASPWSAIVPFGPLAADTWHRFTQFEHNGPFTHLLYTHYPNGGIHGLKLFGTEQE